MRHYRTKDWVSLLPKAVELLNARPMTRNGGVPPAEINSFLQDPVLRSARRQHGVHFNEPSREDEIKAEDQFAETQAEGTQKKISEGSYVFLDRKQKIFDKSFLLQVSA